MNKAELRKAIEGLGETPPDRWTRSELMTRLLQLREEHGMTTKDKAGKTALQQGVTKLNQASKKKSLLMEYVQELGCAPTGKETIAQLQRLGMTRLYLTTVPDGSDPVGFGKGANLRYDEIQMDKQYCQWVRTQYKEHLEDPQGTSCCPQLVRLAMWLEQEATGRKCSPEPEVGVKVKISEPELKATPKVKMEKGYASGSGSPSPHSIEVGILGEVMATLKELKTEVQELKDERPRRQRIGNSTESDFSMVSTSPKHQT